MDHNNKAGEPKFLKKCALPLTGLACVDTLITDLGVFRFTDDGPQLVELAPGVDVDEVKAKTAAEFSVAL